MMVIFEALYMPGPAIEMVEMSVTSHREAVAMFSLLNNQAHVIAFRCLTHDPDELGLNGECWSKYRDNEVGYLGSDFQS